MTTSTAAITKVHDYGIHNAGTIARAAADVGIPFYAAVALFQMESSGDNIWGADRGGTFSGKKGPVTEALYKEFRHLVIDLGHQSNGVGPSQITWKGFFLDMEHKGLKPWVIYDNMKYGLKLLNDYYKQYHSWRVAGQHYNGGYTYGVIFAARVALWKRRLANL